MKKTAIALLLSLSVLVLGAQENDPSVEPEEPDIVLPEVILRIQDFSVEEVEAGLPGEEGLLAPQRSIPLPEAEELDIEEPELPFSVSEGRDLLPAGGGSSLSAQVILGAGTLSHLYSQIALNRIGEEPRFKLKFLHETLDGLAGEDPGSGYDIREDRLEGGIKTHLGRLSLETNGVLDDREQGLQNNSISYSSRVLRRGVAELNLGLPVGERFTLSAGLDSSFATQLLTAPSPEEATELLAGPLFKAELLYSSLRLGFQGRYTYRNLRGEGETLHRLGAGLLFAADFLSDYHFEAEAGWYWNSDLGNFFPFSLTLSGTPFSTVSFRASGGYRVQELNYRDLLTGYPLVDITDVRLPSGRLEDNHGWFTDLGLSFTLTRNLSLQARALLAWNSGLLEPQRLPGDSGLNANGLFPISQEQEVSLGTEARLRLNLGPLVALSAGLQTEFLERSRFTPLHTGSVAIEGATADSRWGGKAGLDFVVGYPSEETEVSLMPLLSVSGFHNINDTIALVVEVDDLLYPAADGLRYTWYPYEAPGLRGTFKVQINL